MPFIHEQTPTALVLWWQNAPTGADIAEVTRILGERAKMGRKLHYICVVSGLAKPPTSDGRDAFIDQADRVMGQSASFQLVLGQNPFLNSIARGLMATSGINRRYPGHIVIHEHLDQALVGVHAETNDDALLRIEPPAGAA